jgi:hypothetical protein
MPWVDLAWNKNPIVALFRSTPTQPILNVVLSKINERKEELNNNTDAMEKINEKDFLSRFMYIQSRNNDIPPW